jgi:hypothetical protein
MPNRPLLLLVAPLLATLGACSAPDPVQPYMAACVNGDTASCGVVHQLTRQEALERATRPVPVAVYAPTYAPGAAAVAYGAALLAPPPGPFALSCVTTTTGPFTNTNCH